MHESLFNRVTERAEIKKMEKGTTAELLAPYKNLISPLHSQGFQGF